MYCPAHFDETRLDVLHALMRARPRGAPGDAEMAALVESRQRS